MRILHARYSLNAAPLKGLSSLATQVFIKG
jgi:hypothetical protein